MPTSCFCIELRDVSWNPHTSSVIWEVQGDLCAVGMPLLRSACCPCLADEFRRHRSARRIPGGGGAHADHPEAARRQPVRIVRQRTGGIVASGCGGSGPAAADAQAGWLQHRPQRWSGGWPNGSARSHSRHSQIHWRCRRSERRDSVGYPREGHVLVRLAAVSWSPPSPEEQVLFLRNIQRLLDEGQFVASYKFALLHALADLCVLRGDDSGAPLTLTTREIAAKFIELYWQQCRPYEIGGQSTGIVLQQNTGKQAAIITGVVQGGRGCASLFRLRQTAPDLWSSLVSSASRTIYVMPLWKLQTVGSERLDFLYANQGRGTEIILKPGIACCFRTFYGLLRNLIQGAWIRFVQNLNADRLGHITDLSSFLFGREREPLAAYQDVLFDVQHGRCFYCHGELHRHADVDHFIPWSRYPTDLGHNFVLAHPQCNNQKSDHLAAEEHLQAWAERIGAHRDELNCRLSNRTSRQIWRHLLGSRPGRIRRQSRPMGRYGSSRMCSGVWEPNGAGSWWHSHGMREDYPICQRSRMKYGPSMNGWDGIQCRADSAVGTNRNHRLIHRQKGKDQGRACAD